MPVNQPTEKKIREIVGLLEQAQARISACAQELDDAQSTEARSSWSAGQVMAHLRACAEVWSANMLAMLAQAEPELPYTHPRQVVKEQGYESQGFQANLRAFQQSRVGLMEALQGLPEAAWSRGAMIEGRRYTVFARARQMALHEVEHCAQLEALVANRSQDRG